MLIAGAISGLAGALTITGIAPHTITLLAAMESYGFNGMSVAFIAASSPIGCIPSSLLFASLIYGGMSVKAPTEIINIMIGIIVFFTALPGVMPVLADRLAKRRQEREAAGAVGKEA